MAVPFPLVGRKRRVLRKPQVHQPSEIRVATERADRALPVERSRIVELECGHHPGTRPLKARFDERCGRTLVAVRRIPGERHVRDLRRPADTGTKQCGPTRQVIRLRWPWQHQVIAPPERGIRRRAHSDAIRPLVDLTVECAHHEIGPKTE